MQARKQYFCDQGLTVDGPYGPVSASQCNLGPHTISVDEVQDLLNVSYAFEGGRARFTAYRRLDTGDPTDIVLSETGSYFVVMTVGGGLGAAARGLSVGYHGSSAVQSRVCESTLTSKGQCKMASQWPAGLPGGTAAKLPPPPSACEVGAAALQARQKIISRVETAADGVGDAEHEPFVRFMGTRAIVTVGLGSVTGNTSDPVHPMADGNASTIHFIYAIYVLDQDGVALALRHLSPREAAPAALTLELPAGVTSVVPYAHCNRHGLFRGRTTPVEPSRTSSRAERCPGAARCADVAEADCQALATELRRWHFQSFGGSGIFSGDSSRMHKAFIAVSEGVATVSVGRAPDIHEVTAQADPAETHWIDYVWAEDQQGAVVAMRDVNSSEAPPVLLTFALPAGTTSLTGYVHCNREGLFRGATVAVQADPAGPPATCSLRHCPGRGLPTPPPATALDGRAQVQALRRLQLERFGAADPFDGDSLPGSKPFARVVARTVVASVGLRSVTGSAEDPAPVGRRLAGAQAVQPVGSIYALDQSGGLVALRQLSPRETDVAALSFAVPEGVAQLTVFANNRELGVIRGETIDIEASQVTPGAGRYAAEVCPDTVPADCQSMAEELRSLQGRYFQAEPFNGTARPALEPHVSFDGATATVTAGRPGGPLHEQDPLTGRWVEYVWAENQLGEVVAMRDVGATEPAPATLSFQLPEGASELRGYVYNSQEGLVQGTAISVPSPGTAAATCSLRLCPGAELPDPPPVKALDCDSFAAELRRRQALQFPGSGQSAAPCGSDLGHCPFLTVNGSRGRVVVGNPPHQMTVSTEANVLHWIDAIYVEDQTGAVVAYRQLSARESSPPALDFNVPPGATTLTPYQHGNRHGLFAGSVVSLGAGVGYQPGAQASCGVQKCIEEFTSRVCTHFTLEFERLQKAIHNNGQAGAFDGREDPEHEPVLLVGAGGEAEVLVGRRAATGDPADPWHPMVASSSPDEVHWIVAIWVLDQHKRLVAYRDLGPTETPPARLGLQVPHGAMSLTPFIFCNRHGMWQGQEVSILENQTMQALRVNTCLFRGCTPLQSSLGPSLAAADLQAEAMDALIALTDARNRMGGICGTALQWGYAIEKVLDPGYTVFLTANFTTGRAHFLLCAKTLGWVGLGFPSGTHAMLNSDMVVGFVDATGRAVVTDRYANSIEEPRLDADLGGTFDLEDTSGWQVCANDACDVGATFVQFSRAFFTGDRFDAVFPQDALQLTVVFAYQGAGSDALTYHGPTRGHGALPWRLDMCPPGQFLQAYACTPCPVGTHRWDTSVYECKRCPLARYADREGLANCTACPLERSTALLGATDAESCQCPRGFYSDTERGNYACTACREGLDCPFGSDLTNYRRWLAGESLEQAGPQPQLLERYWSAIGDPTSAFLCEKTGSCPGGPPETCRNEHQSGFVCARCDAGYLMSPEGVCRQCTSVQMSVVLFPTLPLVFGPILASAYYVTMLGSVERWSSDRNQVTAMFTLLLYHYQMAWLAQSGGVRLPSSSTAGSSTSSMGILMDLLAIFSPECIGITSFEAGFALRLCMPFFVLGIFVFTLCIRNLLARIWTSRREQIRMDPNIVFCCFMSVMFMFHLSVVAISIKLFMCYPHPDGKGSSLIGASYIKCYEDDAWMKMLGGACTAVFVYCIALGSVFVYILLRAPRYFGNEVFRLRWKFLVVRFQPSSYWWGIALLCRGLSLNFANVFFSSAVAQLLWIHGVLCVYTFLVILWEPWRYVLVNVADVLLQIFIISTVSLYLVFAHPTELQQSNALVAVAILLFAPIVPVLAMAAAPWMKCCRNMSMTSRYAEKASVAQELQKAAAAVVVAEGGDVKDLVKRLTPMDRYTVNRAVVILNAELLGMSSSRARLVARDKLQTESLSSLRKSMEEVSESGSEDDDTWKVRVRRSLSRRSDSRAEMLVLSPNSSETASERTPSLAPDEEPVRLDVGTFYQELDPSAGWQGVAAMPAQAQASAWSLRLSQGEQRRPEGCSRVVPGRASVAYPSERSRRPSEGG